MNGKYAKKRLSKERQVRQKKKCLKFIIFVGYLSADRSISEQLMIEHWWSNMWISRVVIFLYTFIVLRFCMQTTAVRWPLGKASNFQTPYNVLESENDTVAVNDVNWMQLNSPRFVNQLPSINIASMFNSENRVEETFNYDSRIGLFLFTRYCGPGSRIRQKFFPNEQRSYNDIDQCCKMHDDCPNFVEKEEHYNQYPGLEIRPQFFSRYGWQISMENHTIFVLQFFLSFRLQCQCDSDFYKCLKQLNTTYANSVGIGYSIFQRHCFELEHPVEGCLQYYS